MAPERERVCVCVGSSICKRARVHARTCRNAYAVVARTRALPRIRTRREDRLSLPLFLSLSLSSVLDRGNLRARQGEPDMTSEFESEEVFSRGFDRHALNRRLYLAHLHYYLSREIEESGFLFRGKFCSIKILYIWFCIIWFFFAILLSKERGC